VRKAGPLQSIGEHHGEELTDGTPAIRPTAI
jgi:hypothetical protein